MDRSKGGRQGSSDPYALIVHDDPDTNGIESYRTRVLERTLNPVWDHRFRLHSFPRAKSAVRVEIFDRKCVTVGCACRSSTVSV